MFTIIIINTMKKIFKPINKTFNKISDKIENTVNKSVGVVNKIINNVHTIPPNVINYLNEYGNEIIISLQLNRAPVAKAVTKH